MSTQQLSTGEQDLWLGYEQRVFGFLLRLTGHRETAEDLTQETFVRAINHLRRAPGKVEEPNQKAWLFRIATNLARDYFRRRKLIEWIPFLPDRHGGISGDASEHVAEQELVNRALRKLPPDSCSILLLKDVEGFTSKEIADMVEQNHEAVRKRLARARESFRVEYLRQRGEHSDLHL